MSNVLSGRITGSTSSTTSLADSADSSNKETCSASETISCSVFIGCSGLKFSEAYSGSFISFSMTRDYQ